MYNKKPKIIFRIVSIAKIVHVDQEHIQNVKRVRLFAAEINTDEKNFAGNTLIAGYRQGRATASHYPAGISGTPVRAVITVPLCGERPRYIYLISEKNRFI